MVARSQSAALNFKFGSQISQAKMREGVDRYHVNYSRIVSVWTSKHTEEQKHYSFFRQRIIRTLETALNNQTLLSSQTPALPKKYYSCRKTIKR